MSNHDKAMIRPPTGQTVGLGHRTWQEGSDTSVRFPCLWSYRFGGLYRVLGSLGFRGP